LLPEHDDHEVAHGSLDELAADHASENYMLQEVSNTAFNCQDNTDKY
jgi:zinc transporter 1